MNYEINDGQTINTIDGKKVTGWIKLPLMFNIARDVVNMKFEIKTAGNVRALDLIPGKYTDIINAPYIPIPLECSKDADEDKQLLQGQEAAVVLLNDNLNCNNLMDEDAIWYDMARLSFHLSDQSDAHPTTVYRYSVGGSVIGNLHAALGHIAGASRVDGMPLHFIGNVGSICHVLFQYAIEVYLKRYYGDRYCDLRLLQTLFITQNLESFLQTFSQDIVDGVKPDDRVPNCNAAPGSWSPVLQPSQRQFIHGRGVMETIPGRVSYDTFIVENATALLGLVTGIIPKLDIKLDELSRITAIDRKLYTAIYQWSSDNDITWPETESA